MTIFRRKENGRGPANSDIDTYIGSATRVEGDLLIEGTVRVDGCVEGDIRGRELVVIIGKSGVVRGSITAQHVFAGGRVEGDINASVGIEVFSTASLEGNCVYSRITIEEGALIQGNYRKNIATEPGENPDGEVPSDDSPPPGS